MKKANLNKTLIIEMRKNGMTYKEIAKKINSTESALKMFIKRNASELLKKRVDKEKIIDYFKKGMTYKEIAIKANVTEDAIKKIMKRNAPEEVKKRRRDRKLKKINVFEPHEEEFKLKSFGLLTKEERLNILNNRSVLSSNNMMSDRNFVMWNRPSYITNKKNGKLHFDKELGLSHDVPRTYTPTLI